MHWTDIARRQAGIITSQQLLKAGVSRWKIETLREKRTLEVTGFRGVYRVGGSPATPDSAAWLAVLASKSVLSYLTAADRWEVPVQPDGRIHITRFDRVAFTRHPMIKVHRTLLVPSAVTDRGGLTITTRTETILDCLGWLPVAKARSLLDRSFQQHWLTPSDIQRRLDEQSGRWGNRQLDRLKRECDPKAESEAERRGQRLLRRGGITGWIANFPILLCGEAFRIDIAFPELKIAIEIDGWAFHRSKERKERDERKANALAQAGWTLLKFGWDDVQGEGEYFLSSIASVLQLRTAM